jgi:hypothetical protein
MLVALQDSGPGLNPDSFDRLFDAFYTTSPAGWAWDCQSAARSSKLTADACGPLALPNLAPPFSSPYR